MSYLNDANGTILREKLPSHRRRDGLIKNAYDITSQSGEDGIIERLFQLIPTEPDRGGRYCVDVGAWDGKHLSNTFSLLVKGQKDWKGVLIEADGKKFVDLVSLNEPLGNTCLNVTVSCMRHSSMSLSYLLRHSTPSDFPNDFDFLCIDVDGTDYWLFHDILTSGFRPKVACVEFNPTMPNDLIYIQPRDYTKRQGSSLQALVQLAASFGYALVECTCYNAFFVRNDLFDKHIKCEIPFVPSVDLLHEVTMGTSLYQLYDGTIKIHGCKKMLWHRVPIDEKRIQMIEDRSFPFMPGTECAANPAYYPNHHEEQVFKYISVDMTPYCQPAKGEDADCGGGIKKRECSRAVLDQLQSDGFALVRGTGIDKSICDEALVSASEFLQEAPEAVRRSCLTKDRARRGYSARNTENFASLIGETGPNDLVRKFRIGHEEQGGTEGGALTQPNVWPSGEDWGEDIAHRFRKSIQTYYDQLCQVANAIVLCISDEYKRQSGEDCFTSIETLTDDSHTSILTILGYQKGKRHHGCKKPLVAAHTDVGVITVLLFDAGTSACLQRYDGNNWVDVKLPSEVPSDPIFVVNIGDCFSDLCGGKLPSTLHRVMPRNDSGSMPLTPRNCLALFVGLKPDQTLHIDGTAITYEEWRKRKIASAQKALRK